MPQYTAPEAPTSCRAPAQQARRKRFLDTIALLAIGFNALILFFVLMLLVVSIGRLRERQRQLRAYAVAHGFSYVAGERLPDELRELAYFRNGLQLRLGRRIKNVIRGNTAGVQALVFDYWFLTPAGVALRTNRTTRATVVCLRTDKSGPWRVFHEDGLDYLKVDRLPRVIADSVRTLHSTPASYRSKLTHGETK